MTDIFKRMKKEAEQKKQKEKQGYSALFSKPKPAEKSAEVKSWTPPSGTQKPDEQKPKDKPAVKTEAIQPTGKKAGKMLGRYFETKKTNLGVGGTAKEANVDLHCFAEEVEGRINLYLSSNKGKLTQIEMGKISTEDFAKRFKPCSEHKCPFDAT